LYNVDIPFEVFVNICPEIKPREYTIASSCVANPKSIHMLIALTSDEVVGEPDDRRLGLTSQHIQHLSQTWKQQDTFLNCFVSDSSFNLPSNNQDVLMIGTGSGIAPFRALLQDKAFKLKNKP